MRRLVLVAAVAAFGWLGTPSPAAADDHNPDGDWWCVHSDTAELTYCQGDPFPEHLPLNEHCYGWTYVVTLPPEACIVLG